MKKLSLTTWIFIALVAGMAFGTLLPGPATKFAVLGDKIGRASCRERV